MEDPTILLDDQPVIPAIQPLPEWRFTQLDAGSPVVPFDASTCQQHYPATHFAYEWVEYWVSYPGAFTIYCGGVKLDALPGGWFRLKLENQLGLATLVPFDAVGRAIAPARTLLVLSKKFPALEQHQRFYERLLDDLFLRIAHLPFVVNAATSQQVQEAMRPPGPLFALHFFTQEAERIIGAIHTIQAMPHQRLSEESQLLPLHAVSGIDTDALLELATTPGRWRPAKTSTSPLARKLRGNLPETVWQNLSRESLDTPENRFAVGAVRQFEQAAGELKRQLWWGSVSPAQRRQVQRVVDACRRMLEDPKFAEVGPAGRPPSSSRVLLRRDGYRDLFALWGLFQRSRRPLFAALDAAMAVRDVASLYELWVYFRLIDEIADITGEPPVLNVIETDSGEIGWGGIAQFGSAGKLRYNASQRTYSEITLRPDMLWQPTEGMPVAFDAKFRLRHTANGDRWTEDDLVKMHAYRDALNVRAAVAVYPGGVSRFWSQSDLSVASLDLYDLLQTEVTGIGALASRPGK